MSGRAPRLVALRAAGLGDLLTVVPALRALADAHPDHRVVLATTPSVATLAARIDAVDEVAVVPGLAPLPGSLARPDVAVNLHGSGPQSHRVLLAAAPDRFVAFRHPDVPASLDGPAWPSEIHEVARWAVLLEAFGIPCATDRLHLDPPPVWLPQAEGATIVHVGAAHAARRWPLGRWVAVVRRLAARGHRVVLTGSASERHLTEVVASDAPLAPAWNLAGRTDVAQLASVVARARLVLSADTGVAHLATAYDVPSVTLFGPVATSRWGPFVRPDLHVALWAGLPGDPHASRVDEDLLRIGPDDVMGAVDALGARPRPVSVT